MKREYVSFDVFDTCLIRRCGRPYKIWDLMAEKLFERDDSRGRLSFTGRRSLAEENAYKSTPYPTLKDIYDELDVTQWGFEQNSIMELEMEIEEQELFPNPEMLKSVNQYREKGFEITFVSDMYLPVEFIRKVLVKYGFCQESDLIFVSAYCKASKYDGKLFDFVLRETKTKARQWVHFGDNKRSDYQIPKSKGIKAYLINDTDFTDEEKHWLDAAFFYQHKNEIELWAGLCRLTRLQTERSYIAAMAVDFIASVYVPYVTYVLKTAKVNGIKTLYFLARDAYIFLEIAKALKKESEGLECRYLKVSRRSLFPCLFYDVNDYELELAIKRNHYRTVADALKYIDIEYDSLSSLTKEKFALDFSLNKKTHRACFAKILIANDSKLIKRCSEEKRSLLLKYFKQEGLFNQKSAMVDLGWVGSCKTIVNYILRNEGHDSVPTFYWGYSRELIYGNQDDLLYIYNKQYDMSKSSCGYLVFEEYASINADGSTIGYKQEDGKIVPVEENGDESVKQLALLNESSTKALCENLNTIKSLQASAFDDIFNLCGLSQFTRMLSKPSKDNIHFFKRIEFENYLVVRKMVRRLPLKELLSLLVWGRLPPTSMIWTEAAIKMTFGPFAPLFFRFYKFSSKTAFANRLRLWWENRM